MLNREVRFFIRWFVLLLFIGFCGTTLQCCGSSLTRSEKEGLEISIQIPPEEDPSLFWLGVQKRSIRAVPEKGDPQELAWEPGGRTALELNEGDSIEFVGYDGSGRVAVSGSAKVTEEKKITIPLRRVL